MNHKQIYISFIILLFFSSVKVVAQTSKDRLVSLHDITVSPSEERFNKYSYSMQQTVIQMLKSNPAINESSIYRKLFNLESFEYNKDSINRELIVYTGHDFSKQKGDYLIYEGKDYSDTQLSVASRIDKKSYGSLYGALHFHKGQHKDYSWNAVSKPDDYFPYVIADSSGGHFRYEDYYLKGGYSIPLKGYSLGVEGEFQGNINYRLTDPRNSNFNTWIKTKMGVGKEFKGHLVSLALHYNYNKQYTSFRNWRPGQQDRYFTHYGLGMLDLRNSPVAFGMSRMYYIHQIGGVGGYVSPMTNSFYIQSLIKFSTSNMRTEETDSRNLYGFLENIIEPSITLSWKKSALKFDLLFYGNNSFRKGRENIYDYIQPDLKRPEIYDYRLIDVRKRYSLNNLDNTINLKTAINGENTIYELNLGTNYYYRSEGYSNTPNHSAVNVVTPYFGARYNKLISDFRFDVIANFFVRKVIDKGYNVDNTQMMYQYAFTPYAYHAYNATGLFLDSSITYTLNKNIQEIGLRFKGLLSVGKRDCDVAYPGLISFSESQTNMLKENPDIHNELWGKLILFFVF